MQEGDYVSATALLSRGADYAAANRSEFTKILFLLSKGMVRLILSTHFIVFTSLTLIVFICFFYLYLF